MNTTATDILSLPSERVTQIAALTAANAYPQEGIYAREGWPVARSTLCTWHETLSKLVAPLVDAMWTDARRQPILLTDATNVRMQAPKKCKGTEFVKK